MMPLTLILPFFDNRGMLEEHLKVWATYPDDLKAQLHVIVVDDCSPKTGRLSRKSLADVGLASMDGFRILTKVRWNWLACRNIGAAHAETDWLLLTDIDHVMPVETLRALVEQPRDRESVYRLSRVDATRRWPYELSDCVVREAKRFHPNTWLMTKAMYDRVGGYDERLSGCYGTDGEFRDRVHAASRAVVNLNTPLIRYPREIIADASTTIYTRKNDPSNDDDLIRRRGERAAIVGWRPLRLTFPFERVA